MRSSTRLDSVIFQLTPTRTRCELVISANGKSETIASGLLNPFLAHLKAAQEQIGKGGYSVVLEPNRVNDASWFTKGTVERFVRFVSTPEILERVYTIESEILQLAKAIYNQSTIDIDLNNVDDLPAKSEETNEGSKPTLGDSEEKAIVLYQPASVSPVDDKSVTQEQNSKVQLVRVLETRKCVLQKEQGMAFARATAAGFDIDNIAALISFAECFGASRMRDACKRFVDLWKAKHESGQWVEVDASEAMSGLPSALASGIVLVNSEQTKSEAGSGQNGIPSDQGQPNPQDYVPGQFPHPMFAPWQMHPQASGQPVFQPYPMQGMPYYQNYPGNNPYFQPPYPPFDDSRSHNNQRTRQRRHSMDSRDTSAESEAQEDDASVERMHDDDGSDEEMSGGRRHRKKGSKSSKKHSGTVVIRNLNYIASAKQGSGNGDTDSERYSGTDEMEEHAEMGEMRKSRKKAPNAEGSGNAGDDGHWQAFQGFLLNDADESNDSVKTSMFAMEGKGQGRRRQPVDGDDASFLGARTKGGSHDLGFSEHDIGDDVACMRKPIDDQMLSFGTNDDINIKDRQTNLQFTEAGGRRGLYGRSTDSGMDYMINGQDKLTDIWDSSLDPVITNGFHDSSNNKGRSSHGVDDESFMILQRSGSSDQVAGSGRTTMAMDYDLSSVVEKPENQAARKGGQSNYEPYDMNLMPDRVTEVGPGSYDPALEYEMQAQVKGNANSNEEKKEVVKATKEGPKKGVKDPKFKSGTRKEKPSKFSPSEDARARAERLRAYKADLQKLKKEQEEEQKKRLEALKIERQKRISARNGGSAAQSSLPLQQARKPLPKLSPVSQKGSKFSDAEPGSSSPLQRSTLKYVSRASVDSIKASKTSKINSGNPDIGKHLRRSASSLSVRKEEKSDLTPESKVTMARIRRLSEPKNIGNPISSGKMQNSETVRRRVSEGHEVKKVPSVAKMDKKKFEALPDTKVRASKVSSVRTQKKSTFTETSIKSNEKMPSTSPSTGHLTKEIAKLSLSVDEDDSYVVEKTVVMLECDKPSASAIRASGDNTVIQNLQHDSYNLGGKPEDDFTVPPPASPIAVKEVHREPCDSRTQLNETGAASTDKMMHDNIGAAVKPHQAPYARVSSLEDPCMTKSDYGKVPPTRFDMAQAGLEVTTVHVSDIQRLDELKVSESASGKHQGKESSKGFRRLLKFGKKNTATGESVVESDKASLDGSVADDNTSSEAFTLKNLLIQEESSSAGTTPKKSSRSFSLLSPFRSKASEKKLST